LTYVTQKNSEVQNVYSLEKGFLRIEEKWN